MRSALTLCVVLLAAGCDGATQTSPWDAPDAPTTDGGTGLDAADANAADANAAEVIEAEVDSPEDDVAQEDAVEDEPGPTPQWATATPIDLTGVVFFEGYAFHRTHAHNEGVGKWYMHVDGPTPVYAPEDGVISARIRDWASGPDIQVAGEPAVPDTRVLLDVGDEQERRWVFLHIWARADLADESALGEVEVNAGDLLGWTSDGFTALDLRLLNWAAPNGLPTTETLHELPWVRCPLEAFPDASLAKAELLDAWSTLAWEPARAARALAADQGNRSPRVHAELTPDSCSTFVMPTELQATVWGLWFNDAGPLEDGHDLGGWFHFPRGTVTLLPNDLLQAETYTVGHSGEAGLFSEMRSYYQHVEDRWFETKVAVSVFLPTPVQDTDEEGCLVLSLDGTQDAQDALWVAFTRTPAGDPAQVDRMTLTATPETGLADCLAYAAANPAETETFVRFPE